MHKSVPVGHPSGWEEIAAYMCRNKVPATNFELFEEDMVTVGASYYCNMSPYFYDWREVFDA